MKKNLMFLTSSFIVINAFCTTIVWAWDDKITHKDLTEQAARQSSLGASDGLFLKQLGLSKDIDEVLLWDNHVCDDDTKKNECTIKEWLRYGAEKEDAERNIPLLDQSHRPFKHFHEPIDNRGLYEGIQWWDDLIDGQSALEWAQDSEAQSQEVEGDQSWLTLRMQYYIALTQKSEPTRKETFAQVFKGLGHQMHLVQAMAVPYHVRNDSHAADFLQGGEWSRKHSCGLISSLKSPTVSRGPQPRSMWLGARTGQRSCLLHLRQMHQVTASGVSVCAVSVPARYIHAPVGMVRKSDVIHTISLIAAFLEHAAELAQQTIP